MRFVERADMAPHKCAVFPTLGAAHTKGYFDTGNDLDGFDPHVYVSIEAAEQMATRLGWLPPAGQHELQQRIDELEAETDDLKAQLAEADSELNAIYILKGRGYATAKKPGRPAKAA